VGKAGAKFDFDKTRWFNQQYLRGRSKKELSNSLQFILKENGIDKDNEYVEAVCEQLKERATFVNDMWLEGGYFFDAPDSYDDKTVRKKWKEDSPNLLVELKNKLLLIEDFSSENIEEVFKGFLIEKNIGMGKLLPVFRLSLTGLGMGPSLFNIASLIGKEETLNRMNTALNNLK
jgi:glutamyl-tRNA synthetase